ncbi:GNAT family N-acetyltransferase [Jannaschia formosa]|nr:GNAT family N-acetyltransferase [Jannaschia formosa]
MPRVHSRAAVTAHYRDRVLPTCRVWVSDDPVTGFLALDEAEGCVTALYLAPEARGRGHGAALLRQAKRDRAALHLWTFEANDRARRFYEVNGFAEEARSDGDNEEGLPDIRYGWTA